MFDVILFQVFEDAANGLVGFHPVPQAYQQISHHRYCGLGHLHIKVRGLAFAQSQQLFGLFEENLYRPPGAVDLHGLFKAQPGVGGDYGVPSPVYAPFGEEHLYFDTFDLANILKVVQLQGSLS